MGALSSRLAIGSAGATACQKEFPSMTPKQCECFGNRVAEEVWLTYWFKKLAGKVPIDSEMAQAILGRCRRIGTSVAPRAEVTNS